MKRQKILFIGSNSFSGSNFIKYFLKNNYIVKGVSRSEEAQVPFLAYKNFGKNQKNPQIENFSFHKIDLNKDITKLVSIIDEFQPSYIINLAAQGMVAESWLNPKHWYQTNIVSQVELHDELRKRKFIKKYLHVSTPEVYGSTDNGFIKENYNFSPTTPYAVSRAACDLHLLSFQKAYDFPVVFTRAANVYGAGQQLYRIIPRTILSARFNKKMELHGGGTSQRSFIHIDDVAEATHQILLNAKPGSSWHISTRNTITIKNLVKKICEICNVNFNSIVNISGERLGKDQSYLLDSESLRKEFDWEDNIKLEEGIKSTIKWIDENSIYFEKVSWDYKHKL